MSEYGLPENRVISRLKPNSDILWPLKGGFSKTKGAVINYWGGGNGGEGRYYVKSEGPNSPSQVNSPKILPAPKMCAQKIVTLPCNNILSVQMLHRKNPYERNYETIFSLD